MRGTLAERFWSKVAKQEGEDGCWLWTGSHDTKGYGQIGTGPRSAVLRKAHRLAWEFANGPAPAGHRVYHRCGSPACVRVDHLYVAEQPPGNTLRLTAELRDYLDGLLLGDGAYKCRSRLSAMLVFGQCPAHRAWYIHVERYLASAGMPLHRVSWGPKVIRFREQEIHSTGMICGWSPSYRNLLPEYERWYPNDGPRRIPADLNFSSPILLANWYMGNGSCDTGRGHPLVSLHTQAYPEEDVQRARDMLNHAIDVRGFVNHSSRAKGRQPLLGFSRYASEKFLEIVHPHVLVPPFRNKLPKKGARNARMVRR